jgi:hypothetical protein
MIYLDTYPDTILIRSNAGIKPNRYTDTTIYSLCGFDHLLRKFHYAVHPLSLLSRLYTRNWRRLSYAPDSVHPPAAPSSADACQTAKVTDTHVCLAYKCGAAAERAARKGKLK